MVDAKKPVPADPAAAGETPADKPAPPPSLYEMWRMKIDLFLSSRKPRLIPTVMASIMVAMLLGLGTWQVIRLHEKNAMLSDIKERLTQAPADLRAHLPHNDDEWKEYHYRPVMLQGRYSSLHTFKLVPRTYEGEVGYQLIVPLKLQDGDILLVNRGFVEKDAAILPEDEEKVIALQGVLRIPESRKPWGSPQSDPARNEWTWTDLVAMRHEMGVNHVVPVVLYEARKTGYDGYPIAGQLPLPLNNRHKQYAVTWYALALILTGVYMMSMGPKQATKDADDKKPAANDDEAMNDPVARRGKYPEATD